VYRPKNDGRPATVNTVGIIRADGSIQTMTVKAFEAESLQQQETPSEEVVL
jgi:hypothetical protein